MATIPMMGLGNESGTDQQTDIEQQYTAGPPVTDMQIPAGQQTYEEWKQQMAPQVERMNLELPDLRIVSEYNRLMVEGKELANRQMEAMVMSGEIDVNALPESPLKNELIVRVTKAGVLAGKKPIHNENGELQIQGLVGIELAVEQLQSINYLTQQKIQLENMNKANREKEQNLKEQSLKTGIISYIQWTGTNESTGQVSAFIQGKDTTTAEPMELPEGTATISFRLPDTTNSTGYKEVMIKTGDWIIKCTDNTMWTLADTEYQEYLITKTQEPTGTN